MPETVTIIGAGLAGSEAAWQCAVRGVPVTLHEMRPKVMTPAHKTDRFAELVCSNSLRSDSLANAVGVLKEEMRLLGSLIMSCADEHRVPAGSALAVDRHAFSSAVTERLMARPEVTVVREEVRAIPEDGIVVVATGPLTSDALAEEIKGLLGEEYLYFYDAAAPIITADSIDMARAFWGSRYGKGEGEDYLNCPMDKEEYERFWEALVTAEVHPMKEFEKEVYFEGCMPVEEMARRDKDTLLFGPLKPVGLVNPHSGRRPYAVVQLRRENREGTLFNLVGFQTHLRWPEQQRVFRMIPGLENADFVRYGVMHRNTFINGPHHLDPMYQLRKRPGLFFAGQMTGVEGYVESASSGLVAGVSAAYLARGMEPPIFPRETAHGSLAAHVSTAREEGFQPMNVNFGLMPEVPGRMGKKEKRKLQADRALQAMTNFAKTLR